MKAFGLASSVLLLLSFSGCTGSECKGSASNAARPSSAIECGGGEVCYRGSCVRQCNAGSERSSDLRCDDDSTCDSVRPFCNDGYCSSCEVGESCVPDLNICEAVRRIDFDGGPRDATVPLAFTPLDGGSIDGSVLVRAEPDAGMVSAVEFSHRGEIEVATILLAPTRTRSGLIRAEVLDLRTSTVSEDPTPAYEDLSEPDVTCEIVAQRRVEPRTPVDLGTIAVEGNVVPGSYQLQFQAGRYNLAMAPPPDLLRYSVRGTPRDLGIRGNNNGMPRLTTAPWPPQAPGLPPPRFYIPHALVTSSATQSLLTRGLVVADPPSGPIELTWERKDGTGQDYPCSTPENVESCALPGMRVVARVAGPTHTLICEAFETTRIRLAEGLLAEFRRRNALSPGFSEAFFLERRNAQRLIVPTDLNQGIRVDLSLIIRDSVQSEITFE